MKKRFWKNVWQYLLLLALGVFLVVFLPCCSTKKQIEYVDREVVKYETKYVFDTTFVDRHDSVYHTIFQKGDTVYDTKYVEKTMWRDRVVNKSDTCWRDSVVTEYKESVKEIVKIPKIYTIAFVISIIIIIFAVVKLVRWLKKHYSIV